MKIAFQVNGVDRGELEIDDELLEMALDKPDFIAGEVREFLYSVFDE